MSNTQYLPGISQPSDPHQDVGYMIFMLPVNLSLRKLKANRSIGTAVMLFGVIMCSLSVAKSFSAVIGLRFLLGVGQSFIQGLTMYTSLWYQRDELGTRSGMLFYLIFYNHIMPPFVLTLLSVF